jgi:Peptidase family M23
MRRLPTLTTFLTLAGLAAAALAGLATAALAGRVAAAPAGAAWTWPVAGEVITPYRNGTDPYATGQHRGIDIAAPVGTPVVAATGGEVRFAGTAGSSGRTVSIRTGDGYDTSYLHLSSLAVRAGAHVSSGDRIGAVGTTGTRSATAPHLHFGVRDAGTRHAYHDPLAFLPPTAPAPRPPAPVPAPAPEPAPPRPAPVPFRTVAPRPRGAPAPRVAPGPRSVPAPRGVPAPRPSRAPRGTPGREPVPGRSPLPAPAPSPLAGPRTMTRPLQAGGDAPGSRALSPDASPPRARVSRAVSDLPHSGQGERAAGHSAGLADNHSRTEADSVPEPDAPGADLGWVVACGGLLLAAAILGLTDDGRRRTSRTRAKLVRILRPLAGGR